MIPIKIYSPTTKTTRILSLSENLMKKDMEIGIKQERKEDNPPDNESSQGIELELWLMEIFNRWEYYYD